MARIYNFSAGPSTLPLPVLEEIQNDLLDYKGVGLSIIEMSHRSKDYSEVHQEAKNLLHEVFGIPKNYKIIFCTGGASMQFAMIPMNFLHQGSCDYIDTGAWSAKAIKEAKIQGKAHRVAGSSKDTNYNYIPSQDQLDLDPNARFVHITTNNTIFGTQYKNLPDTGGVPLVCDMSSDILSKKMDFDSIGMIYAGAQKNMGPAGVTVAAIREDMLENLAEGLPSLLTYKTFVNKDSLFNTPPCFAIYTIKLVLEWIKKVGGMETIQKWNEEKGDLLYGMMEKYSEFYNGTTEKESRSLMNVTLRLPNVELEKIFIADATKAGFGGLKGHRSVGGIRVSMYNAMPVEGVKKLTEFMDDFRKKNS
ncbi:MAG: phosphoserine transaminase [Candidatus Cloacimonetes bacterium 4572_55]|nr:MAG: phosphoserine transaminase [Candidatus Cloacimonetes bacterium 4572_55]